MRREALAQRFWEELKRECCADPTTASRCVMVSREQALRAARRAVEPAP